MNRISNKISYKTVEKRARDVLVEKKSKFIATAAPCSTEAEAIDFVNEIRKEFPDATHNVYAYSIDENQLFRYSDDGEPSGTSGMPVLDTMRKDDIVDTAIVVTRYFGGTLLGTGGLVHAYSESARLALSAAGIVTKKMCNVVSVTADYSFIGKIQHLAAEMHLLIEDTLYTDKAVFFVCVPIELTERFEKEITEATNARALCAVTDTKYINTPI